MRNSVATALLAALLVTPAVAATAGASAPGPRLIVRCYPQTDLRPRDLDLVREVLTRAFADTLDVAWQVCGSRGTQAWTDRCDQPLGSADVALRFTDDHVDERPEVLGAAVEGHDQVGVMATVYVNHVRAVSTRTGLAFGQLAGRVSAHEIVHLLLGPGSHRGAGLMRPDWSEQQLRSRPAWWQISVDQRRALAAAVRRRLQNAGHRRNGD